MLLRRAGARDGDGLAHHPAGQGDHHDLVVEGELGLHVPVRQAALVGAPRADAPAVVDAGVGAERVAQPRAHERAERRLPRPRADRREHLPRRELHQRRHLEIVHALHVLVDARAQLRILGVERDLLDADRHRWQVPRPGGRRIAGPGEVDHHGAGRVHAGLDDPRAGGLLDVDDVLVPAHDHRERRVTLQRGEVPVVGDALVRERDHAGAALLAHEARGLAHRRAVRGRDVAAPEGLAPVRGLVGHHDADEPDAHRAVAPDLDDRAGGQRRVEAAHVGGDPRGPELADARGELGDGDVVFVVAEDHVGDPDRVHAVDHAAPVVEAREDARREEVPGEGHDHRVRGVRGGVVPHEVLEPRQVLERIDVVDGDDAEGGPAQGRIVGGGHDRSARIVAERAPRR